jgi:hypothetical protein
MTANNPNYWFNGSYAQPLVANPPNGQQANNSRMATWHFSKLIPIEIYKDGAWRKNDGRYDRGVAQVVTIYATCQPLGETLRNESEGESNEMKLLVHVDSHQPENIAIASAFPALFPNGVFLAGVEEGAFLDTRGFGMIVQWMGKRWRVETVKPLLYAGDEEVSIRNCVYRAECSLFTDVQQEMRVTKLNEIIAP